jgi:hypothetical protein
VPYTEINGSISGGKNATLPLMTRSLILGLHRTHPPIKPFKLKVFHVKFPIRKTPPLLNNVLLLFQPP